MIECVTFDWWHTVAETPWPDYDDRMRTLRIERIRETLAEEGIVLEPDILFRAYDRHTDLLVRSWQNLIDLTAEEQMRAYLEEYVYSVADHEEFLDKRVGAARLKELRRRATIVEGYR